MTDTHLMLIRLTELMLENEQQSLSVDKLFDDPKIGDQVKSIQIDSPYQQLLLEGVLTEYINEGELAVRFTVEGFFHYLLGETLFYKTADKEINYLHQIVMNSQLEGIFEGAEYCLIRDINAQQMGRLSYLLDLSEERINKVCGRALQYAVAIMGVESFFNNFFHVITPSKSILLNNLLINLSYSNKPDIIRDLELIIWKTVAPATIENCLLLSGQLNKKNLQEIALFDSKWSELNNLDYELQLSVQSEIYKKLGLAYLKLSEKPKAIECMEKAYKILPDSAEFEEIKLELKSTIGMVRKGLGELSKAQELYLDVLSKTEQPRYWQINASTRMRLGEIFKQSNETEKALEWISGTIPLLRKMLGNYHTETAKALGYLGSVKIYQKKWAEAKTLIEESMNIRMRLLGENNTKTCIAYVNYGEVLMESGDLVQSRYYLEKALTIRQNRFGKMHQDVAYTIFKIGNLSRLEGNYLKALEHHQEALDIRLKKLGPAHVFVRQSRLEIMNLYSKLGNRSAFQNQKSIFLQDFKPDSVEQEKMNALEKEFRD